MKTGLQENKGKKEKRVSRKRSFLMYGILALVVISVAIGAVQISPGGSDNSAAAGGSWGGSGSLEDPYQISDAAGLKMLADDVNNDPQNDFDGEYFILTDDIYLNVAPYNTGAGWVPIGFNDEHTFKGNLDGCGHSVAGLTINNSGINNGLFGNVDGGTIMNLAVLNVSITGDDWNGGVAGYCYSTIENCYVTGNVTGTAFPSNTGGIVGGIQGGTIENCYFSGTITGTSLNGGIAGRINGSGSIQNCYSIGNLVIHSGGRTVYNGGIVGYSTNSGDVSNCFFLHEGTLRGIGYHASNTGAEPMSNNEMRTQSTFTDAGWDFTQTGTIYQTWFMHSTIAYPMHPMLSWQIADSGIGTQDDPFIITTIQQLANIQIFANTGTSSGVYWHLGKDLDLTAYLAYGPNNNSGRGWAPIGDFGITFRGYFDGCEHTIAGLKINTTNNNVGLFGYTNGSTIKNLGLVNVSVKGNNYTGGLVGRSASTTFENCFVTGSVVGNSYVGGLVGYSDKAINNCYNTGAVSGNFFVGGMVGYNSGSIENCYNIGEVKGTQYSNYIGGIAGYNNSGTVENCYNAGAVSGAENVGGILGYLWGDKAVNCFFLESQDVGGINYGLHGIGLDYYNGGTFSDIGTEAVGEAEMCNQNTFTDAGWDFSSSAWGMYLKNDNTGDAYGYPYISTIENFILIQPDGGSMVYNGKPAPEPPGWSPVPIDNYNDKHPITATLTYDPANPVEIGTYGINIAPVDNPYYQIRLCDDAQYTITAPPKSYTITPTSDANSMITPSKAVTVQSGSSYTFTYSAASGYHISSVLINGTALDQAQITGSYTFTNVLYNQTIEVKSASGAGTSGSGTSVTLTVDIVGGNGTAEYRIGSGQYESFTGAQLITIGSNLYVSVVADSGYSFVEWTGDTNSKNAELNFANVTGDIHLVAHLSNDNAPGSAGQNGNYGISNLVFAILALIIGIIAIAVGVRKNAEGKASVTAAVAGLFSLIVGIASIIVFFLTEDLSLSMTATDNWTVWMAVLFVVAVVFAAVSFWFSKRNDS